ncbi:MAG: V-type ATPase 116kDa subunit family protein [Bacteroidales bacterium]|nr:V-type ATPase 116kDa subunit family protein [Bacteroidales bacterium]
MNKYTFLVFHKQYTDFLEKLRNVGVLHVSERPMGVLENEQLRDKLQASALVSKVIEDTKALLPKNATPAKANGSNGAELLTQFDAMVAEKYRLQQLLTTIEKEAERMEIWGDFDTEKMQSLARQGHIIQCWTCPPAKFDEEWYSAFNAINIGQSGSMLCFATVTHGPLTIDADLVTLNEKNTSELKAEVKQISAEIEAHKAKMETWAVDNIANLEKYALQIEEGIDWKRVEMNTIATADKKVMLLEGYAPVENADALKAMLESEGVYYEETLADENDEQTPIKLKNNAFSRMYESLTRMYGMPDYGEFDPTPILAPFFSLFWGMCMGDAGYGLVLILLGFLAKKKMGESMRGMMNLVISLGIFTTVVGAVMGTFFGYNLIESVNTPEWMKNFMIGGQTMVAGMTFDKMMLVALGIGIFHICVAMIVKLVGETMRKGFLNSLSTWGWTLLIVGSVVIASLMILGVLPDNISKIALIVVAGLSAVGIYLLNNIHRNPIVNIFSGLYDTYNMASGLLGDILSYIRLYALGLAGGLLGGAFNQLAQMAKDGCSSIPGVGIVLGVIFFGLIFVVGHALNIALSCLSAFVHPLRLSFVEYFKNAGYDGKGVAYKPFQTKEEK